MKLNIIVSDAMPDNTILIVPKIQMDYLSIGYVKDIMEKSVAIINIARDEKEKEE